MTTEDEPRRIIRAVDFVAETLERAAAEVPDNERERSEALLETARLFRKSDYPRMVVPIE
jgi:hypothetical protein